MFKKNINIGVIGLGNWGTALANHLAKKGYKVTGWTQNQEIVDSTNKVHVSLKYHTNIVLSENLFCTSRIEDLIDCSYLVLALPSSLIGFMSNQLKKLNHDSIIISGIKGMESSTGKTPLDYLSTFNKEFSSQAVLSGPCFATDLVKSLPCALVSASKNKEIALKVAHLFSNESLKVYTSTDSIGVELGGILKNIIALAVGVSDGLNLGNSARAGLITRGLAEMKRYALKFNADERTLSGLSGLGDLSMTATSNESRNRTVGLRLGQGEKLADIIKSLGSTAESVYTTPIIAKTTKSINIYMPITEAVNELLKGKITPMEAVKSLITRPLRDELE